MQKGLPFSYQLTQLPSVLWHCWLNDRKGIQPVQSCLLVVTIWLELVTSKFQLSLSPPSPLLTQNPEQWHSGTSLPGFSWKMAVKRVLLLYQPTQVVLEDWPLNKGMRFLMTLSNDIQWTENNEIYKIKTIQSCKHHIHINQCLQCFDTVVWASGRHPIYLKKLLQHSIQVFLGKSVRDTL